MTHDTGPDDVPWFPDYINYKLPPPRPLEIPTDPERLEQATAAFEGKASAPAARDGWGRTFLARCGINPDDETDVRAGYESCREAHARWLATGQGEIDAESYAMLVDAIKDLYGWRQFPLHWPAPTLVMTPQPLRNLLPRVKGAE